MINFKKTISSIAMSVALVFPNYSYARDYSKFYILPSSIGTTSKIENVELIMLQMTILDMKSDDIVEEMHSLFKIDKNVIKKINYNILENKKNNKLLIKNYKPLYLNEKQYNFVLLYYNVVFPKINNQKNTSNIYLPIVGLGAIALGGSALFKSKAFDRKNDQPVNEPELDFKKLKLIKDDDVYDGVNLNEMSPKIKLVNPQNFYANGYRGQGVKVAVMDTGVEANHSDLKDNVDIEGSVSYTSDQIQDLSGHGTHVAGIIAAKNNNKGVQGIAPDAKILSFDIIQDGVSNEDIAGSYLTAMNNGAKIINNSWTMSNTNLKLWEEHFDNYNQMFESMKDDYKLDLALEVFQNLRTNDVINVWSLGNEGQSQTSLYQALPYFDNSLQGYWVNVAALDDNLVISDYSNRCGITKDFCISAPGTRINSTDLNDTYSIRSGTSMAAPIVSGSLALMRSAFPELSAPDILNILFNTATDLGEKGVDDIYGHGLVNLEKAISPQGDMVIYTGNSTTSESYSVTNSRINLGGNIGQAVAQSFIENNIDIMAVDSYSRSYKTNMASFLTPNQNKNENHLNLINEYGNLKILLNVDDDKIIKSEALDYLTGSSGLAIGDEIFSTYVLQNENVKTLLSKSKYENENYTVKATLGKSFENNSVLGEKSSGAFKSMQSETSFVNTEIDYNLSPKYTFNINGTATNTSFTNQFISGKSIIRNEIGISLISKFKNSNLKIGLSNPLNIKSGTIDVAVPSARTASIDGTTTTGVEHQISKTKIETLETLNINLEYDFNIQTGNKSNNYFNTKMSYNTYQNTADLEFSYKVNF